MRWSTTVVPIVPTGATTAELNKWLGEVSPLLHKFMNVRGFVFVLVIGIYLAKDGVNLTSCLYVTIASLLYRFWVFKFL